MIQIGSSTTRYTCISFYLYMYLYSTAYAYNGMLHAVKYTTYITRVCTTVFWCFLRTHNDRRFSRKGTPAYFIYHK